MIRLKDAEKTYENGTKAVRGISFQIDDGEFVFLVGPSGSGKSTIIKMLTGEIAPDTGEVRHGTNLDIAVFDQARSAIDETVSLWDAMTGDPSMRVSGRSDQVMVRGNPRHVVFF